MNSCSTGKADDIPVRRPLADELKLLIDTKTPSRESKNIVAFAPVGDTSMENVDWDTIDPHLIFKRVDYSKQVPTGRFEIKK